MTRFPWNRRTRPAELLALIGLDRSGVALRRLGQWWRADCAQRQQAWLRLREAEGRQAVLEELRMLGHAQRSAHVMASQRCLLQAQAAHDRAECQRWLAMAITQGRRLGQNVLHNAAPHGHPSVVVVQHQDARAALILVVRDNGRGTARGAPTGAGHEWRDSAQVMARCGGTLRIEPTYAGTVVTATVPLSRKGDTDDSPTNALAASMRPAWARTALARDQPVRPRARGAPTGAGHRRSPANS